MEHIARLVVDEVENQGLPDNKYDKFGNDIGSDNDSGAASGSDDSDIENASKDLKSVLKKPTVQEVVVTKPYLPPQPDPAILDFSSLSPLTPEIIARQGLWNTAISLNKLT